jgi:hypothetical protein
MKVLIIVISFFLIFLFFRAYLRHKRIVAIVEKEYLEIIKDDKFKVKGRFE